MCLKVLGKPYDISLTWAIYCTNTTLLLTWRISVYHKKPFFCQNAITYFDLHKLTMCKSLNTYKVLITTNYARRFKYLVQLYKKFGVSQFHQKTTLSFISENIWWWKCLDVFQVRLISQKTNKIHIYQENHTFEMLMAIRLVMTSSVSTSAKNILYINAPADSLEIGLHKLRLVKHSQHTVYRNEIIHGSFS